MRKLPKELRTEINRSAHHAGLMYAEQFRRKLIAEAERHIKSGDSAEKFIASLGRLEAKINRGSDD